MELLLSSGCKNCAVLYSGDTGFYSGARTLLPLLAERGIEAEMRPGLSSMQVLAARLGRPWQDWVLCSAHGTNCDPVAAVCQGKPAFFLTGGPDGPARLCGELVRAGLGELPVTVGESLGFEEEAVSSMTAARCAGKTFAPLNVLLCEPAPRYPRRAPTALEGFPAPDAVFAGGSGGELPEILQAVRRANPKARVCVSAISLETLHAAMAELRDPEVTQISVSRSRPAEQLHLLLAQNPVFLITGALS